MTNKATNIRERKKSAAKAEAILKGAMKEFLKNGYAGTSMDKITKSAGVSKATIYSHFEDKENLFKAVMMDLVKDKFRTMTALDTPQSLEQDPKIVLSAITTKLLADSQKDKTFHDFMRIIIGESGRFPELAKVYVNNIAKPAIEIMTKYCTSHPTLKLEDPEATVRVMIGTIVYFIILQNMMHGADIMPLDSDRVVKTLTDLITKN